MERRNLPIEFNEYISLTDLGIDKGSIIFRNVMFSSEKHLCVIKEEDDQKKIFMINLKEKDTIKKDTIAESAILHPNEELLCLRDSISLQLFDLKAKERIMAESLPEKIEYWKWLSNNILGLIGTKSVYHWNIKSKIGLKKIFDRKASISEFQVINYIGDEEERWLGLEAISVKNGEIIGSIQLISNDDIGSNQMIAGHAGTIVKMRNINLQKKIRTLIFISKNSGVSNGKIHIVPLENSTGSESIRKDYEIIFFEASNNDFPIATHYSEETDFILILTKGGYIYLYHILISKCIFNTKISNDTFFCTVNGIFKPSLWAINKNGIIFEISINNSKIIHFLIDKFNNKDLIYRILERSNLPGGENIFIEKFEKEVTEGNGIEAAKIAARSPNGILRIKKTIEILKKMPVKGGIHPLLSYFNNVLEISKLNNVESLEIVIPAISGNKREIIQRWIRDDKLTFTEELGDLVSKVGEDLGLSIYLKCNAPEKVIEKYIKLDMIEKIVPYCENRNYIPNYYNLFSEVIQKNIKKSLELAKRIITSKTCNVNIIEIAKFFEKKQAFSELTEFLLDIVSDDEKNSEAQTYCLQVNIKNMPEVAKAIIKNKIFTHYDKEEIGRSFEEINDFLNAAENYENYEDIKRVFLKMDFFDSKLLIDVTKNFNLNQFLEFSILLLKEKSEFLDQIIEMIAHYTDIIGIENCLSIFKKLNNQLGRYLYLSRVNKDYFTEKIALDYIEILVLEKKYDELINFLRDSSIYKPLEVLNYLKSQKLEINEPYIIVCDKNNLIGKLLSYLKSKDDFQAIKSYAKKANAEKLERILNELISSEMFQDQEINDILEIIDDLSKFNLDYITNLLEENKKLYLALPWLEKKLYETGETLPEMHTALAKIYIENDKNPERFLRENQYYDSYIIGKMLESKDPKLALIAYEKGKNNQDFLRVSLDAGLYKKLAEYLINRSDVNLWDKFLSSKNPKFNDVISAIISVASSNSFDDPTKLSIAAKKLLDHGLYEYLESFLNAILFGKSKNHIKESSGLQNLLFITAFHASSPDNDLKNRLLEYVKKLDKYDPKNISDFAIKKDFLDVAVSIYEKFQLHKEMIEILLDIKKWQSHGMTKESQYYKAIEYLQKYPNDLNLLSFFSIKQLELGYLEEGLKNYLKGDDFSNIENVLKYVEEDRKEKRKKGKKLVKDKISELLLEILIKAISKLITPSTLLETEIAYCICRLKLRDKLDRLFIKEKDEIINWDEVAKRVEEDLDYENSKEIYLHIGNYKKVAEICIKLNDHAGAFNAAKKAGSDQIWLLVAKKCLKNSDYQLAHASGLYLVGDGDSFKQLISTYEKLQLFNEAIELAEAGIVIDNAYKGLITDLAILYSKYEEEKLLPILKKYGKKCHTNLLIKEMEKSLQWKELCYLYELNDEYEQCLKVMIKHSPTVWDPDIFLKCLPFAKDDLIEEAINLYIKEHPLLLDDLLKALGSSVDQGRIISFIEKIGHLPLIRGYLQSKAHHNQSAGMAFCKILIDEKNYGEIEKLIKSGICLDVEIAKMLEDNSSEPLKLISAKIYFALRQWNSAYQLYIQLGYYRDATLIVWKSQNSSLAEKLILENLKNDDPYGLLCTIHCCSDLLGYDKILKLLWRHTMFKENPKISKDLLSLIIIAAVSEISTRSNS